MRVAYPYLDSVFNNFITHCQRFFQDLFIECVPVIT